MRAGLGWVFLSLGCTAVAPNPAPAPAHERRVPDEDCEPIPVDEQPCAPPWLDQCDPVIASCASVDHCLAALADLPNACAPEPESTACLDHVVEVLTSSGDLRPVLDAMLSPSTSQAYAARVAIGRMDREQLGKMQLLHPDRALRAMWLAMPFEDGAPATEARWDALRATPDVVFDLFVESGAATHWSRRAQALASELPERFDLAFARKLACHAGGRGPAEATSIPLFIGDGHSFTVLRDVLAWPDWRMQEFGIAWAIKLGDSEALPQIDALARDHWSALVRESAVRASELLRTGSAADRKQALEDPTQRVESHGVRACAPERGGYWHVRAHDGVREVTSEPGPAHGIVDVVAHIPKFGRQTMSLPTARGWHTATSRWEGEGSLLYVPIAGPPREVLRARVIDLVAAPFGDIAIVAQGWGDASVVVLEWSKDEIAPRAHHHVRLPGPATRVEVDDDDLVITIVTAGGVVELDRSGEMTLLPCAE